MHRFRARIGFVMFACCSALPPAMHVGGLGNSVTVMSVFPAPDAITLGSMSGEEDLYPTSVTLIPALVRSALICLAAACPVGSSAGNSREALLACANFVA